MAAAVGAGGEGGGARDRTGGRLHWIVRRRCVCGSVIGEGVGMK